MIHLFFSHDSWFHSLRDDVIHDSFTFFNSDSWFKISLPPPRLHANLLSFLSERPPVIFIIHARIIHSLF